jgi:hypothetical protein
MYRWIWRGLPGGKAARLMQLGLLLLAAALLLWFVVYPWASIHVPFDQAGLG